MLPPGLYPSVLDKLLAAFVAYDSLHGETITMRAFSSRCYQDTKTFEREVRDLFLRVALQYSADLAEAYEQGDLGDREQLAYLGIYARPELYERSGNCVIKTGLGELRAAVDCGKYPYFRAAMKRILEYGVTIEQEVFLTE